MHVGSSHDDKSENRDVEKDAHAPAEPRRKLFRTAEVDRVRLTKGVEVIEKS